jgi:hypothetical protein
MNISPLIDAARKPSPWRIGNDVLYSLCHTNPGHTTTEEIIAKVWLIGRAYAAAIERRRNKTEMNDNYYIDSVAPKIKASKIDNWIASVSQYNSPSTESFPSLIRVHLKVTQLFSKISGLEKRSLASKYLHFHLPHLFYIYDTRAVEALRLFSHITGRASKSENLGDNEYRKFFEKCISLQNHITENYGVCLTPRELDNLLLIAYAK